MGVLDFIFGLIGLFVLLLCVVGYASIKYGENKEETKKRGKKKC